MWRLAIQAAHRRKRPLVELANLVESGQAEKAGFEIPERLHLPELIEALHNLQGSLRLSDFQLALGGRRPQPRDTATEIALYALEQDTPTKLVFRSRAAREA